MDTMLPGLAGDIAMVCRPGKCEQRRVAAGARHLGPHAVPHERTAAVSGDAERERDARDWAPRGRVLAQGQAGAGVFHPQPAGM